MGLIHVHHDQVGGFARGQGPGGFAQPQHLRPLPGGQGYHLGAVVLNKVLPSYFLDDDATEVAERLCRESQDLAGQLPAEVGDPTAVARVLREIGESFLNYRVVASREAEEQREMGHVPDLVCLAPFFDTDIYDLSGLLRLGAQIWR